ncbi:MAG: CHASE2 domain-containing protein, partial [Cyanobacteria bacterium P01_E01_bin.42]
MPEILLVAIICIARLSGSLQFLELFLLDRFLQWRPTEPQDDRITIIGIDEEDIREIGTHPIPDRDLAQLLRTLDEYKPRAIGLDIIRDIPVEPGYPELAKAFTEIPNIIGIEQRAEPIIKPPPSLSPEKV